MKKYKWLSEFLEQLAGEQIVRADAELDSLSSFPLLIIDAAFWQKVFQIANLRKYRFAGIWVDDLSATLQVTACVEFVGEHLLLRTLIASSDSQLASITPYYQAANRFERHARDMFGIIFVDNNDTRRWTRHKAWSGNHFPLRKNFSVANIPSAVTAPDIDYPFITAYGSGTYEIPVGPVHAGIIEPGHFRFQAAGENIINLEERLGYLHKGIEKIAEGRDIAGLIKLANRVSGDSAVAHAWAACRAAENAYDVVLPLRANFLRAIMAERERIANHLGDFAAICNDVGFGFAYYQLMRLKELWVRMNAQAFGHRFMMDCIVLGGVAVDLTDNNKSAMQVQLQELKKELDELYPMIENNSSLHDRLKTTGVLSFEVASSLGALGYVGRASGCKLDLRRDAAYSPYEQFKIRVPVYNTGDVLARTRIRAQEILVALELLDGLLKNLPRTPIKTIWQKQQKAAEGVGLIEGWRGEILTYVRFNENCLVERYFPRDPSWFNWLALEKLINNDIVPDFPVCNKSVNGSYAGVDL